MRKIKLTNTFKKVLRRVKKRGLKLSKLEEVVVKLAQGQELAVKHRVHQLQGNYNGKLECHITPDWLLIYEFTTRDIILYRTGSHADLFN